MEKKVEIYIDGSCLANGKKTAIAGIGIVGYSNGIRIFTYSKLDTDLKTNNEAEYAALVDALSLIDLDIKEDVDITIYSDSKLIVNQMKGLWKISKKELKELHDIAKRYIKRANNPIQLVWIPRTRNTEANALAQNITNAKK